MSALTRVGLGAAFLIHGLAHALPGMRAADRAAGWVAGEPTAMLVVPATIFWVAAMAGLMAAGFGLLGADPFRRIWGTAGAVGAVGSILLLAAFRPEFALPGLLLSATLLGVLSWILSRGLRPADTYRTPGGWRRVRDIAALAFLAYLVVAVGARPWHMRWGSTAEELRAALPGDELTPQPVRYGMQHAVTIRAPADEVWPWLVQIGQDRAGFYSYDWLERLFGARIRNVDRIVDEWQHLEAGDSVFATQPGYLGFPQPFGWRVARLDPGRALVLENWGAFVLSPIDSGSTRLIVRTRGGGETRPTDLLLAPAGLLIFELPHFIMERKMLLGIRDRAEGRSGVATR